MQVSYNWLKELVEFDLDPHQLAAKLTSIGTLVESVESLSANLDNVVVAKIVACDPLPAKDNLKICKVELGRDIQMTIVCGAPNVRIGMKAPLALPGAILSGNVTVQSIEKFGVLSEGVLCSQAELGLSDDHSGLMEIDPAIKSGADLKTALNLEDHVLSFDLTPNRADCLSAIGIAREISALTGAPIKRPAVEIKETAEQAATQVEISIEDTEGCPRYAARLIRGIKIGRSPWWIQQRLLASGIRCINNIVDITNFVMLEYGQPLHAFDFDNFSQPKVVIKRAWSGEVFTTLDGVQRKLSDDVLLITDGNGPVAIGGIMGGQYSEVSDKTVNILLESAYFNSSIIRRGRKHLGLTSEAQMRFERGADPNIVPVALDRAASLMEKYAGGKVSAGTVDCYPNKIESLKLELRPSRVNQLLKTELSSPTMIDILKGLEFRVTPGKNVTVEVPTFRPDVTREIDLVEEIARVYGYDKIPVVMRAGGSLVVSRSVNEIFTRRLKQVMIGQGYFEVVTNSIGDPKLINLVDPGVKAVEIINPISEDLKWLRPSLLPGLLGVVSQNVSHQVRTVKVFEIGTVMESRADNAPKESQRIGLAISGTDSGENWAFHPQEFGLHDLQGALDTIEELLRFKLQIVPASISTFDQSCSFEILIDGSNVGRCGKVSAAILKAYSIKSEVYAIEMDFDQLVDRSSGSGSYVSLPRFPAIERDIAVVIDEAIQSSSVVKVINQAADENLRKIIVWDVYRGRQVPTGKKSIAYRLIFQNESKTLTDGEIDNVFNKIIDSLKGELGAELRS